MSGFGAVPVLSTHFSLGDFVKLVKIIFPWRISRTCRNHFSLKNFAKLSRVKIIFPSRISWNCHRSKSPFPLGELVFRRIIISIGTRFRKLSPKMRIGSAFTNCRRNLRFPAKCFQKARLTCVRVGSVSESCSHKKDIMQNALMEDAISKKAPGNTVRKPSQDLKAS